MANWFPYAIRKTYLAKVPPDVSPADATVFELMDVALQEIYNRGTVTQINPRLELAHDIAVLFELRSHTSAMTMAEYIMPRLNGAAKAKYELRARQRYYSEITYRVLGLLEEWNLHSSTVLNTDVILTTFDMADV